MFSMIHSVTLRASIITECFSSVSCFNTISVEVGYREDISLNKNVFAGQVKVLFFSENTHIVEYFAKYCLV